MLTLFYSHDSGLSYWLKPEEVSLEMLEDLSAEKVFKPLTKAERATLKKELKNFRHRYENWMPTDALKNAIEIRERELKEDDDHSTKKKAA